MGAEVEVCLEKLEGHVLKLREQMDYQAGLMMALCKEKEHGAGDKRGISASARSLEGDILRKAICETIEVLEESRKAFKSRKLEALRKKLTSVLINTP